MTLREIFGAIPMGLGSYALGLMEMKSPELAGRLAAAYDRPIAAFRIDFETGDPLAIAAADLVGDENGTASDDGSGSAGGRGPLPGSVGVPG